MQSSFSILLCPSIEKEFSLGSNKTWDAAELWMTMDYDEIIQKILGITLPYFELEDIFVGVSQDRGISQQSFPCGQPIIIFTW